MKVFIDTNVILEYILKRDNYDSAKAALLKLSKNGDDMFISVGGFYTMLYIIESYLKKDLGMVGDEKVDSLRVIMRQILNLCNVAEHDDKTLMESINDANFKDLEDSCQLHVAEKIGCKLLLTFNIPDYKDSFNLTKIDILTPQNYLSRQ